jgi:hypothetical protein
MVRVRIGYGMQWGFSLLAVLAMMLLSPSEASAQKSKKKSSSKTEKPKTEIRVQPGAKFTPTRTGAPGTVMNYFWPMKPGMSWTHRTVRIRMDDSGKVVATDTAFNTHRVISDSEFSLQHLPIVKCETKGYRIGGLDTGRTVAYYYVDDSIAMTVMNNSINHRLNAVFLVSPLREGNAWHEKYDDTAYCVIGGLVDSVETPIGVFDSVMMTVTRVGYTELVKFYAQGYGLIKSVFRAPGPGSHGVVAMVTEMVALKPPDPAENLGSQ